MATISIAWKHRLALPKARDAAEEVAADLERRFALQYSWKGDTVHFARPGLEGTMRLGKGEVRLDCTLGFLLSAIKPAIEQEVLKEFERRFGPATPPRKK